MDNQNQQVTPEEAVRCGAKAADASSDVILEATGLCKHFPVHNFFGRTKQVVRAVDGIDLAIRRGETFGLVGESGCGKSTLGRTLIRMYEPTSGKIVFGGHDITSAHGRELVDIHRKMQIIFQDPYMSLDPHMNVRQIIAEPMRVGAKLTDDEIDARVAELLGSVRAMLGVLGLDPLDPRWATGGGDQRLTAVTDGLVALALEQRAAARAVRGESFSDLLVWAGRPPAQRVLSVSARVMRDDDGRPEGSVLSFNDVTELVAALQAKDDFLAGVSHELRTPLTSIRGYTELLAMDDGLPGHVRSGLEVIERNADQLLVLVEDLLGTAGSVLEPQLVAADLVQVVEQSVAAAGPKAAAGGVDLRVEAPRRLVLECDPVRIGQVLDNLLSNAIKYSPSGGPVTVSITPAGRAVQLRVADHGMGMRPQDAEEVFGRFFRSANARMSAIPGLGLGLAVAREIVERHGGGIRCESEPGEGTVFTVLLPLAGPGAAGSGPLEALQRQD